MGHNEEVKTGSDLEYYSGDTGRDGGDLKISI